MDNRVRPPWYLVGAGALLLAASMLMLFFAGDESGTVSKDEWAFYPVLFGFTAGIGIMLGGGMLLAIDGQDVAHAREEQQEILSDMAKVDGIPELAQLVAFNERQMRVYQDLTTSQAHSSYRRSQFAFLVGLAFIGIAIGASLLGEDTASTAAATGLSGVGAAFAAYISATYLRVYERTLDQLNFYYRQPLMNSYLLTAERLAMGMQREKQEGAYDQLLAEVLACASAPHLSAEQGAVAHMSRADRRKRRLRRSVADRPKP